MTFLKMFRDFEGKFDLMHCDERRGPTAAEKNPTTFCNIYSCVSNSQTVIVASI